MRKHFEKLPCSTQPSWFSYNRHDSQYNHHDPVTFSEACLAYASSKLCESIWGVLIGKGLICFTYTSYTNFDRILNWIMKIKMASRKQTRLFIRYVLRLIFMLAMSLSLCPVHAVWPRGWCIAVLHRSTLQNYNSSSLALSCIVNTVHCNRTDQIQIQVQIQMGSNSRGKSCI